MFDVDFILHTKIYQISRNRKLWGQTMLVEASSGALVWWSDWEIYRELEGQGPFEHMLMKTVEFTEDKIAFCIRHGCQGIFSRLPVIGKPLAEEKKEQDRTIDIYTSQ